MSYIINQYKSNFIKRYDRDEIIPDYSPADFPGLVCEEGVFRNSAGVDIRYYTYYYDGFDRTKLILYCHGLGPGHTWYLSQIDTLCRAGYRALVPDFTGCGSSGGERLTSVNAPTRDAIELLELLKPAEEVIPVGHSLGGYTALNVANLLPKVKKAVIISGFLSISDEMMGFVKLRILADRVKKFEKKLDPEMSAVDNLAYIAQTKDRILWIHSTDDPVVNYKYNAGRVKKLNNPNVRLVTVEHKNHFPQFTEEAIARMNTWLNEYSRAVSEKKLVTVEEKKAFFAERTIFKMTEQDPAVSEEILRFLKD